MTTPPTPPPAAPQPPKGDKATNSIAALQQAFAKLSAADRDALARAGVTIPQGDISAIATGNYRFGLRCRKCNKVALYFVGTEWEMRGVKHDVPPSIPHWEIAWTQNLAPTDIDRHSPRCQHCRVTLPRQQSGAFDYGNELLNSAGGTGRSCLVVVAEFEVSRDRAFDRRAVDRYRRERDRGPGDLSQTGVSGDYNATPKPASQIIDEKFGEGTSQQLEQVAQETGVAAYTPQRG